MTYAELIENLQALPKDRLQDTVTVYVQGTDEFYPVVEDYPFNVSDETCDVLDPGHAYIVI